MLTVERAKELAMQNYNKGGDTIVECYEDYQIEALIKTGVNTEKKLLNWFKTQYEIDEEYRKAALWHAYGTTDEEEIKKMLNPKTEPEFKIGDIVFVSNPDTEYEAEYGDRYHPCFFGKVTEVETYGNETTVEVTFNYLGNYVWYYSPNELSLASEVKDMTLEEFSNKYLVQVNAVYL